MAGPFRTQDFELFVQLEGSYGTSPGALAATDAFKCNAKNPFKRNIARYDRDKDQGNQASVLSFQIGKSSSDWAIDGDIIPSGNAATPTLCDMDPFFEAHFGSKHKATAHTTLAAGSTTTVINFTAGGVAASGTQVGDFIAVDVSAAFGVEVRQIPTGGITGDAVTVDRALSAAPAAGRAVYVGTTYKLTFATLASLHLWAYLSGDNFRHKAGGCDARQMEVACDFSSTTPVATVGFSGGGLAVTTHATARPTPTTAGEPLLPPAAKAWIGTALYCVTKATLSSNNGIEQRMSESCSLVPTGLKRTGNGGRYAVTQEIDLLLLSGAIEGYYDNETTLTAYDCLVQLGLLPGAMVAWRTPKFVPNPVETPEADGEVALSLSGKCYGLSVVDTEVAFAIF